MPYRNESQAESAGPDNTPVSQYTVELSERDFEALNNLKNRNGAGFGNVMVENIAIWKMINRICETPKKSIWLKVPEIEHPNWLV